jgi:C-terminal processing protease CtpA/Prc
LKLCAGFKDGHSTASSFIIESYFGTRTAPIRVRYLNEMVTVSNVYQTSDDNPGKIQLGDQIIEVDNKKVTDLFMINMPFVSCPNESARYRDLANLTLRTNKQEMNLKIIRNNSEMQVKTTTLKARDLQKKEHEQADRLAITSLNDSVTLIKCKFADSIALENYFKTRQQIKWIIFDMRSTTNWILPCVSKYLVQNKSIFAFYSYPLINSASQTSELFPLFIGPDNNNFVSVTPIILVNENTQSQGEFQTMALQQMPGAITIGSQTAGTDGNVSTYLIPGNIEVRMTTIRILYPDLSETQNYGIKIDYYSRPTVDDLVHNRDPELDLALRIIQHGTSGLKKYNNRRPVPFRLH